MLSAPPLPAMRSAVNEKALENEARQLEDLCISLIREKNWSALEDLLDPACQFVSARGSLGRAEAMDLMRSMELGDVRMKDFKVTRSGESIVISFWMGGPESVAGQAAREDFSPRLSVWSRASGSWRCVAYADFNLG